MALEIERETDLTPYNTFNVKATARYLAHIRNEQQLLELISSPIFKENKRLILGGGSNIVFRNDFDGLIIRSEENKIQVTKQTEDDIHIQVAAGMVWHDLVTICLENNWGGIENLSLIPGTVGAAPIQNIGAYGAEVKDVVVKVDGILLNTGSSRSLTNADCKFSYRESIFKHELNKIFFISSVTLRMTKKTHKINSSYEALNMRLTQHNIASPTIHDVARTVIEIRKSKLPDPSLIGNAGSFFKNPAVTSHQLKSLQQSYPTIPFYPFENQMFKVPAGWLIEKCGWKGKRIDQVGVHEQQALVIVNHGGASGEEIFRLSEQIVSDVKEKFGLMLTREVNVID
jgi:UDP-N-acetylmuramate dehydrogenase